MSNAKFTPGPWKVEGGGFVGGPVGYGRVCQMWDKFEKDFKNSEANAQLIAAAPDLLEACRIARNRLYVHQSQTTKGIVRQLDAAIAKALGERPDKPEAGGFDER